MTSSSYHAILIDSGFASSFFLNEYLRKAPKTAKFLVLERGPYYDQQERIERRLMPLPMGGDVMRQEGAPDKEWVFSMGFGGSSNCWWGCTPRFFPNDFRMKSAYGVGRDWPISYDELEPYYCETEQIMQISGASDGAPYPMSKPYPQPPHIFTDPDKLIKATYPTLFYNQPTARARVATDTRASCCANAICQLCPVDAKFTILNGFRNTYADPRVELVTDALVTHLDLAGGIAKGVHYQHQGEDKYASADLVVLGANAMFNPFLMLKSGMEHPELGCNLGEQTSILVDVNLKGVDNFQGSTSITGHGYMFYDGEFRKDRGASLIETWNEPEFRLEAGRLREILRVKLVVEDLLLHENKVVVDPEKPTRPLAIFKGFSPYAMKSIDMAKDLIAEMTKDLPVESILVRPKINSTEAHVIGTTRMGDDPADSLVDKGSVSHSIRNLVVVGASTYPTMAAANPTLTLSALSIYAARKLA